MPQAETAASAPCPRSPEELPLRRADTRARRRAESRRRLRTGAAALLGAMTLVAGAASAQGTGGASADAPAAATEASAPAARPTLRTGDSGRAVRELQRRLKVRPADGEFGPRTRRAVRRYQKRAGLPVDGVAGPATLERLGVRVTAAKAPRVPAVLQRIAECESGDNPKAISPDGRYRGKYQFLRSTWKRHGGSGDPARASEAEQDRVAVALYRDQGAKPWPHCGAKA